MTKPTASAEGAVMNEPVAWVHFSGFEHRHEGNNSPYGTPVVSWKHMEHWTDEHWIPLYLRPTPDSELIKLLEKAKNYAHTVALNRYFDASDCMRYIANIDAYLSKLNPDDRKVP